MAKAKTRFSSWYEYNSDADTNNLRFIISVDGIKVEDLSDVVNELKESVKRAIVKPNKVKVEYPTFTTKESLLEYLKTSKNTRVNISGIEDLSNLFNDPYFHDKPNGFFFGVRYWDFTGVKNINSMFENCKNARINLIKLKNLNRLAYMNDTLKGTNTTEEYLDKVDKWSRGVLDGETGA